MSSLLLHSMDAAWASSAPAVLQAAPDDTESVEGAASLRLTALPGSLGAQAVFAPAAPLDLEEFEELRFWVRGSRVAHGSGAAPFYLEFSYTDDGDAPGEEHRWFVPVNRPGRWEQRRIGIGGDRRGAVSGLRFRCLTDLPFVCHLDELLAVREEMIPDLEAALTAHLHDRVALPGLTAVPLAQTANPNDTQVVLPLTPGFSVRNHVALRGGAGADEFHDVTAVADDAAAGTTTLDFGPDGALAGTFAAGAAGVSVVVPVFIESPPEPAAVTPLPCVVVTPLEVREDAERTGYFTQRDSFRPRGDSAVCSVRPAPRAYFLDYQVTAVAPSREQQAHVYTMLARRLSADVPLRINGVQSPVAILPPPALEERKLGTLASLYVRVGTRMEVAPRQERPSVRQAEVRAGRTDAPSDLEGVVIQL